MPIDPFQMIHIGPLKIKKRNLCSMIILSAFLPSVVPIKCSSHSSHEAPQQKPPPSRPFPDPSPPLPFCLPPLIDAVPLLSLSEACSELVLRARQGRVRGKIVPPQSAAPRLLSRRAGRSLEPVLPGQCAPGGAIMWRARPMLLGELGGSSGCRGADVGSMESSSGEQSAVVVVAAAAAAAFSGPALNVCIYQFIRTLISFHFQ